MNKTEMIINEVAAGVRTEMENSIASGCHGMHYEHIVGNAYVDVDVFEEHCGGYYTVVESVMVSHFDTRHRSPMLEERIKCVLPDWEELKTFMMADGRLSA